MKKLFTLFTALLFIGSMMVVHADTWTVAGSNTTILGASWDPSKTANDMINTDGNNWYLLKANKSGSNSVEYKVVKNHVWGTEYPGSNASISLSGTSYDVLFKFVNDNNHSVSATKVTSWTVAGSQAVMGSNWNTGDTNNDMTRSGDNWTLTKSHVLLEVGTTYECKVAANHAWTYAFPSSNKTFSVTEDGYYDVTVTFNTSTFAVNVATTFLEPAVPPTPTIKLHGTFTGSWADTEEFAIASGDATASLTMTNLAKGNYTFGVKINGNWVSNGSAFTRANNSHAITSGSGDCTFNADRNGDYTFTWTYATNTLEIGYPAIPAQSVSFNSLASQILKGSVINLANCVTSSGIDEPTYRFYIKEKNGEYGDAINANYNFNANGEYVVKVEALEYGEPVAFDESNVVVYQSYTFTNGSTIYVDFSAVSGDVKGVNYPKVDQVGMDWDATGAGTVKTITFTSNVTWTTMADAFIKTEKNGWANQPFTVPGTGKNCVVVAEDGASYTWGTYVPGPPTVEMKGGWDTWTDPVEFTGDAISVSVTKHLAVGEYEFKIIVGGDWRGNGHTYNRDYTGAEGITTNGDNMKITADVEDDYTFTWIYETNALNITFPALPDPDAFVAGSAAEIFGTAWDPAIAANKMTWDEGLSKFTKTYTVDKAYKSVGLKVVYDNQWYGVEGGEDNVKFSLSGAGEFTVLYDKTTHHVTLEGAIVGEEQFDFEYAAVAANGEGNWAHGENWNAATTTNRMTEVAENIWEISFDNVPAKECQLKFCFDGTWDHEFGGVFSAFGTESSAVYGNTSSSINFTSVAGSIITVRLDMSNFNFATKEGAKFTVLQEEPIAEIGGKFIINAKGDTAVFSRGNLQYKQSSDTWRCAPNQYDWAGEAANEQMGNPAYAGWVDLFSWSIGAENNYGATSAYLSTAYHNKDFVDWGTKFEGEWSTLSSAQWQYLLNSRSDANDKWGMAMIEDNLGMIILPEEWNAPTGITFVPRANPTSELWDDEDRIDDTEDHYRVKAENMPANKFTLDEWAELEAAGAIFLPYAGRRSGGYGNHINRLDEEVAEEYNFTYYENYLGTYWTSTAGNKAKGEANYVYTFRYESGDYNWGKAVVWSENGRYGQSVRLVHIIPRQYTVTYTAGGAEGTVPTDENTYVDGTAITLASAAGLSMDGYKFAGWKFKGTTYNDTYTVNNVLANEEIVFEAQWELDWQTVREDLTEGWYYTMCLEKAVSHVQGGSIWRVVSKAANASDVILEEVVLPLDAGRPYIFYATASTLEVVYTGAAVGAPVNDEANNGLVGSFVKASIAQSSDNYIIYNNELYYVNSDNVYVGANRAYLNMADVPAYNSGAASAPGRRRITMGVHSEQTATGMDELNASETPVKVMINGQMYILRGEKIYDATGRMIK